MSIIDKRFIFHLFCKYELLSEILFEYFANIRHDDTLFVNNEKSRFLDDDISGNMVA